MVVTLICLSSSSLHLRVILSVTPLPPIAERKREGLGLCPLSFFPLIPGTQPSDITRLIGYLWSNSYSIRNTLTNLIPLYSIPRMCQALNCMWRTLSHMWSQWEWKMHKQKERDDNFNNSKLWQTLSLSRPSQESCDRNLPGCSQWNQITRRHLWWGGT